MPKRQTFTATIIDAGGGGAFVEVPFDVEKEFGSKRPRIKAVIEGIPYRGLLARMGGENHILIILKNIREQAGKTIGDRVKITVELDTEPLVLEIPKDIASALKRIKRLGRSLKHSPTPISGNMCSGSKRQRRQRQGLIV